MLNTIINLTSDIKHNPAARKAYLLGVADGIIITTLIWVIGATL